MDINASMAMDLLDAVVTDAGANHVYTDTSGVKASEYVGMRCQYVHDTSEGFVGGCIIGRMLIRLGVTPQVLLRRNATGLYAMADYLEELKAVGFTRGAKIFLAEVQALQDQGFAWGVAVENAKSYYEDAVAGAGDGFK